MTRIAVNGIHLNAIVSGAGPALLLLHGFTGSTATWRPFLRAWPGFRVVRVDLIGHGRSDSPPDASRYSMAHGVADLLALLDRLAVERTAVLGYSLGGRVALHLALAAPQRLTALIVESASSGMEDEGERARRRAADAELARSIEAGGIEAFVDRWQAQPLFASQARLPRAVWERQRRQRLAQSPAGLANSLRGMGAGSQEFLLPQLAALRLPALFIAGALDERYAAEARRMADAVPGAEIGVIAEAGHAVHLEQPAAFAAAVRRFLAERVAPAGRGGQTVGAASPGR